jgi:hypothetical protein
MARKKKLQNPMPKYKPKLGKNISQNQNNKKNKKVQKLKNPKQTPNIKYGHNNR